jgi:ribosome assembly protein YihI (activator of Der GTPase)
LPDPPPLVRSDPPLGSGHKVKLMDSERVIFTEETNPQNYLKLVASGEVDGSMLEALEDYVKRQKKRLGLTPASRIKSGIEKAKSNLANDE